MPIEACTNKTIFTYEATTDKAVFKERDISSSKVKIEIQPTQISRTKIDTRTVNNSDKNNDPIKSNATSIVKKCIDCIGGAAIGLAGTIIGNLVAGPIGGLIGGVVGSAAGEIIGDVVGNKITE